MYHFFTGITMILGLVFTLALSVTSAAAQSPPSAQCAAVATPAPCGQPQDGEELCSYKGCCWNAAFGANACFFPSYNAVPIKYVHVIQSCHFDAGFANTTVAIMNLWFHTHFPQAYKLGLELDSDPNAGVGQLRFMAQAWIVSMFLDCPPGIPGLLCPSAGQISNFTDAVRRGYIYWHAYPFNGEPELSTADMVGAAFSLTHALDDAFGLPRKATMSQRDVPGMSRSLIPILLANGVQAYSGGVNPFSTPPFVPRAFVWRDPASGTSMPFLLHPYGYGGITYNDSVVIPGFEHALVFAWRSDNMGPPQSIQEVQGDFSIIMHAFPGAQVFSSTFDNYTSLLTASVVSTLPVLEREIGDTWVHGSASDPQKSGMMKRAMALRQGCIAAGLCNASDPVFLNFTRLLLKNNEHTWGCNLRIYLDDYGNWSNAQLQAQLAAKAPNFLTTIASWQEQRDWGLTYPLQALQQAEHPLAPMLEAAWADLRPPAQPSPTGDGWTPVTPGQPQRAGSWTLAFDVATGGLSLLSESSSGSVWAGPSSPGSLLGYLQYETYDAPTIMQWLTDYAGNIHEPPNYPQAFGRPNIAEANATRQSIQQSLRGVWSKQTAPGVQSYLVQAGFSGSLVADYGAPEDVWLRYDVPTGAGNNIPASALRLSPPPLYSCLSPLRSSPQLSINLTIALYNKTATRMPEGMFLRFNTSCGTKGFCDWRVDKLGSWVDPFDVQPGGNQYHHGVGSGLLVAQGTAGSGSSVALFIAAPDVPIASFGSPRIFPTPTTDPAVRSEGGAFLLNDNTWSVNYPEWMPWVEGDESIQYRFSLTVLPARQ